MTATDDPFKQPSNHQWAGQVETESSIHDLRGAVAAMSFIMRNVIAVSRFAGALSTARIQA